MVVRGLVLALLALAVAGGWLAWRGDRADALEITTAVVTRGDVERSVSTSGKVRPVVSVEVGSQLSGQIKEIYVDFSSPVRQGQEVARIDPRTFEARVREAEAQMEIAEADLAIEEATVVRADALLQKAQRDHARARSLVARGSAAEATLDAALAAFETAKADRAIALAQVENAKATLLQRRATLESARIDLDRTFIRSPIEGVVIDRAVEVGQTVAASLSAPTLFTIARSLVEIEIDAQVDEADIGQIAVGHPARFTVDTFPERSFEGVVTQIRLAPTDLQNVVTYTVVIEATNRDGRLLPGMTANVEIATGSSRDVLLVPNEALRFRPRGAVLDRVVETPDGTEPTPPAAGPAVALAATPAPRTAEAAAAGQSTANGTVATGRKGTVWVLRGDRRIERRDLFLGLVGAEATEVRSGNLQPGERLVTRVSERSR